MTEGPWPARLALLLIPLLLGSCQRDQEGIAEILIEGELADQGERAPSRVQPRSLRQSLNLLYTLSHDEAVSGVLLRLGPVEGGPARYQELRDGLSRLRESGRTLHCQLENATNFSYWIAASACERITLSPAGSLHLVGLASESYYLRELLASIGLEGDFLRVGTHKGAAEFLTRDDMSPETREMLEEMLDDLMALLVTGIAEGRELDEATVHDLIDRGPFDADTAREAGLVDAVGYYDEAREALREAAPGEAPLLERYDPHQRRADSQGLLQALLSGQRPEPEGDRVALLLLSGPIVSSGASGSLIGDQISLSALRTWLNEIRQDPQIRAVVVRIDSPGGSASASDEIWRELIRLRADLPVITSMGDVAASGGYYIAAASDEIYAQPGTMTGSIGVVGGKVVADELLNDIGVTPVLLRRGQNAALTSLTRPFSRSEHQALQQHMQSTYERFIHCIVQGRAMDEAAVRPLATGRVWSGQRALDLGLIDHMGGLHEALGRARELGGLEDDAMVETFPKPLPLIQQLEQLASPPSLLRASAEATPNSEVAHVTGQALDLATLLDHDPVLTIWPVHVRVH